MRNHLDDKEMAAACAGLDLGESATAHLKECLACRRGLADFRRAVVARKSALEHNEPDWAAQKRAVMSRLVPAAAPTSGRRHHRWIRPLLAAAATLLLAVGVGVLVPRSGPEPSPTPAPNLPVEQILAEAESLLEDDGLLDFEVFDNLSDDDLNALFDGQVS